MLKPYLKPYLIGYVNEHYEDVDDQLVFAYDEAHATKIVLETFQDVKKSILHIFSFTALLLWNDQGSSRWCRLCSRRLSF